MKRTAGVALITVMLILTIATIMAVGMAAAMQMDIRRSSNVFNHEQAYQYVIGAEAWSGALLARDRKNNKTDSLQDDWAMVLPPMPIENGQITGSIEDLQGRFNLNNLLQDGKDNKDAIMQLRRLLRQLELNEDLVNVMLDWMDSNEDPRAAGAEDNSYLNRTQPYRTANRQFTSSSELLLLNGMDFTAYEKLQPYVTVLPAGTRLNVNTAPGLVLQTLSDKLSAETASSLADKNREKGFDSVDDFLKDPALAGMDINKNQISVESQYFRLHTHVQTGTLVIYMVTELYRDSSGRVQVIRRHRGQA